MLAKRIIPCLDVDKGRVVKGVNFLNLRDAGDPVEVARRYEAEGADELVFLDITASHEQRDTLVDIVRRTAEQVFMPLTVGGGIRNVDDCRRLLNAGADKVSVNSAAVKTPTSSRPPAGGSGPSASSSRSTPSGSSRTGARSGRSTSTAGASPRAWRPSPGPRKSSAAAPARSS